MECFTVYSDEVEGRLDHLYYSQKVFQLFKKSSFEIKTINEVVEYLKTGFPAGAKLQSQNGEGIIQIRPTNIDDDNLLKFDKNIFVKKELIENKGQEILKKEDVLFNNTNSQELVGKTAYFDVKGNYFCSNHITRIGVKKDQILPRYLWILLNLYQKKKVFYTICTNWNNQSGVNTGLLKTIKIPIPPLSTQNRIVEVMESAYSVKKQKEAEARQLLDSIDDYVLSELGIELPELKDEMCFIVDSNEVQSKRADAYYYQPKFESYKTLDFSFETKSIKEIAVEIKTGLPIRKDFRVNDGKYPYYGANGIIGYMDKYTHDGTYLIIGQDGYIGNHYVISGKFWASNHNWVAKIVEEVNIDYVKIFLDCWNYGYLITGGVIPKLTKEAFESIRIPLPNLSIQNKIAEEVKTRIEKAEKLKTEGKKILEEAKEKVEEIILR